MSQWDTAAHSYAKTGLPLTCGSRKMSLFPHFVEQFSIGVDLTLASCSLLDKYAQYAHSHGPGTLPLRDIPQHMETRF